MIGRKRRKCVVRKKQIIVKTKGENHPKAEGSEIWVVGALVDDVWISAEDIFDHTWLRKMRMIGWNGYTDNLPDNVWGLIPLGNCITLVFEKNRWRGKCEVIYEGRTLEIDTYDECDNGLLYVEIGKEL